MGREVGEGGVFVGIAVAVILGMGFYSACWILGHCLGWW